MIQKEYIGLDKIDLCEAVLEDFSVKSIFLVTGNASYNLSGACKSLQKTLAKYRVSEFSNFKIIGNIYQNKNLIEEIL